MPDRGDRNPSATAPIVLAVVGVTGLALSTAVAVGALEATVDERMRNWVSAPPPQASPRLLVAMITLGDADIIVLLTVLTVLRCVVLGSRKSEIRRLVAAVLGSAGLVYVLNQAIGRTGSYDLPGHAAGPGSNAYPSGHVVAVVVLTGMAVWAIRGRGAPRRPALLAAGLVGGAEALALLLLQQHWLTDLVGGWVLGMAVVLLATRSSHSSRTPPVPALTWSPR